MTEPAGQIAGDSHPAFIKKAEVDTRLRLWAAIQTRE